MKLLKLESNNINNVMEMLIDKGINLPFVCGGKGTCGKCKIQVINGELPITEYDKKFFSSQELETGFRLACKAYPKGTIEIKLLTEESMNIVSEYERINLNTEFKENKFGIIIDIGTTTIAFELVNTNGDIINSYTSINSQRIFGADVISRIQNSINGKGQQLKELIQKDIIKGIKNICANLKIDKIIISANTTMIHLLMGFNCEGLGVFPFTPVTLNKIESTFNEIFESNLLNSPVTILPSISTYVGGDILSGILMCDLDKKENISMLIDIGTNGEIVIGNKHNILCASTAVGPALEGGNISCGIASVEGAISNISIIEDNIKFKTINNKKPIGICGSGVIDIIAELLKNNYINKTGLLIDKYFEDGIVIEDNIIFTQKDIREVQMAKAAICSGIEILIQQYGCKIKDIETIYISGGFGYHININNALLIGLIPKEFESKIKVIGNSSLGGAEKYLLDKESDKQIEKILEITKEIQLANDINFNDLYLKNMYF